VRRLWSRLREANPLVVDSILAALVLVAGLISLTAEPTPANPTPTDALAVVLVVVGFGALALRRRYPIAVLVVATVCAIVYVVRDYPDNGLPVIALMALYTVASHRPRRVWVTAVTIFLVILGISAVTHPNEVNLVDLVGNVAIFGIAAVFGDSVRLRKAYTGALEARAAALERSQQTEAKRAVAEERLRIARELHDVVAHAMSVVAVQSGVGAHVIDSDPAEAKRILENVKVTSREALDEMRRLLGVLRRQESDGDGPVLDLAPVPGLHGVEGLAQSLREAGVPVQVQVSGTRIDVPPGVDLCAFRIVQEALTNVLRHAGPARALVDVEYRPGAVTVRVTDDGRGAAAAVASVASGGGHGLLGMRERVAVFGGELTTGPHVGGGFRVSATLPFERTSAAPLSLDGPGQ
jgi:signal transduction histidine kinase